MRFSTFLLKNLLRRKVRTTLTCIGIAVAVGTTISLLGISDSFERGMVQSFSGRGVDIVVLEANVLDQLTSDISLAARDQVEQVPGVKAAAPGLLDIIAYRMGNTDKSLVLQGWDPDSFLFDSLEFIEGGPIGKDEEGTVMLGDELSKQIQKKLGDTLEIDGHAMKVVGVFHSPIWQENSCFIIPLKAMQKMTLREGRITGMSVILQNAGASHDEVQKICDQIDQLTDDNGNSYRLSAKQTNDYVSNSLHIKATHAMAWLTSMIAITVGAIGMLNTMIMSVVERVKEISILRAIGWRKGRVVKMILGESLILSAGGAVLGAILAVLMTRWLVSLPQVSAYMHADISAAVIAKGFGLAIVVGILGGIYPAYRAATLLPSDGLRHE